ncbi:hypothetical protein NQ117_03850 [Paenibacillus sp. SC116]|uniref:hypothetical protein n=1 Tax=Paenibacillus sp. SC116 TaxID=2968986 RepID=UPI00215B1B03|nr:hypothetical protein [Paenibacillus sp. SC116]MCR8842806.1 hypothetical protein [Paenibacillus sp. SC116]
MKPCKHWLIKNGSRRALGSSLTTVLLGIELVTRFGLKVLLIHQDDEDDGLEYFIRSSMHTGSSDGRLTQLSVPDGWGEYKRLVQNELMDIPMFVACTSPIIPGLDVLRIVDSCENMAQRGITNERFGSVRDVRTLMQYSANAYDIVLWDWNRPLPRQAAELEAQSDREMGMHDPEQVYSAGTITLFTQDLRDVNLWRDPKYRHGNSGLEQKKIWVVSSYDPEAHLNLANLKKHMRGMLIYAVPYDAQLRHYANEGHLVHYVLQQQYRNNKHGASRLLNYVDQLAEQLLLEAVLPNRKANEGGRRWNG